MESQGKPLREQAGRRLRRTLVLGTTAPPHPPTQPSKNIDQTQSRREGHPLAVILNSWIYPFHAI